MLQGHTWTNGVNCRVNLICILLHTRKCTLQMHPYTPSAPQVLKQSSVLKWSLWHIRICGRTSLLTKSIKAQSTYTSPLCCTRVWRLGMWLATLVNEYTMCTLTVSQYFRQNIHKLDGMKIECTIYYNHCPSHRVSRKPLYNMYILT